MNRQDEPSVGLFGILRSLHRKETGVVPRIAASLVSGLVLTAVALAGGWLIAFCERSSSMGTLGQRRYYSVDDDHLAATFAFCSLVWLGLLVWIWRGANRSRFPLTAAAGTLGLGLATVFASIAIERTRIFEEEYLITALCLVAGAVTLLIWLPTVQRLRMGRRVVDSENLVNVTCPHCSYSLIGLRVLRCPECGTEFTIDELIRSQNYGSASISARSNAAPRIAPCPAEDPVDAHDERAARNA